MVDKIVCDGLHSPGQIRDAFQKKNCPEGDIGTYRREGGKKFPFFASSKRGHIFMEGGVKMFLSHVPCSLLCFCFHTILSISLGLAACSCMT